ncbi:hypothetical protein B0T26DRAFT_673828 [Lasiosphaeria miniovina]|uniref:Secreted protein n=1 Tax=Lasiosphaeria miniovina TaxID=1954250 RepID=A0AA40E2T5_9PEZI|nr:uncharacterized protein B0T26DRAFT_673828 [Lasiosphaeria miniovina]KAK0722076.1 hypothetical protein B0T26DRAFT_673828 [Lasiosphaeria miniovina]
MSLTLHNLFLFLLCLSLTPPSGGSEKQISCRDSLASGRPKCQKLLFQLGCIAEADHTISSGLVPSKSRAKSLGFLDVRCRLLPWTSAAPLKDTTATALASPSKFRLTEFWLRPPKKICSLARLGICSMRAVMNLPWLAAGLRMHT